MGEKRKNSDLYACDTCECVLSSRSSLKRHQLIHQNKRPFICDVCSLTFRESGALVRHQVVHSEERLYVCTFPGCDKSFKRKDKLKVHDLVHSTEKVFKCDYPGCESAYKYKQNLVEHQATHSNIRSYVCDQCSLSFISKKGLTLHQKIHDKNRETFCCTFPGCDRVYLSKQHLIAHTSVHDGSSKYVCDVCQKIFASLSNLEVHKAGHRGEKLYSCDVCNKTFLQKAHLTTHKQCVHTTERKFKCTFESCNAAFKIKSNLNGHVKIHKNIRAYKCHFPDCNRTFVQSSSRSVHEKSFHNKRNEMYVKRKEERMVKFLKANNLSYDREVTIDYRKCGENDTWARLDFVVYQPNLIVITSVDEFQHKGREIICEVSRMSKVVTSIRASGDQRPILWLRFNPDTFSVDGERLRVTIEEREETLLEIITNAESEIGDSDVKILYLFYNAIYTGSEHLTPEVCVSPDYSPVWRALVGRVVV